MDRYIYQLAVPPSLPRANTCSRLGESWMDYILVGQSPTSWSAVVHVMRQGQAASRTKGFIFSYLLPVGHHTVHLVACRRLGSYVSTTQTA